jgi:hypothetical protein
MSLVGLRWGKAVAGWRVSGGLVQRWELEDSVRRAEHDFIKFECFLHFMQLELAKRLTLKYLLYSTSSHLS